MSLLSLKNLNVSYGRIQALHNISLDVEKGDIVCLLGANGAGKSTTIKAIMGLVNSNPNSIFYNGECISRMKPNKIVQKKIAMVPEGRHIFPELTVQENMLMGAYVRRDKDNLVGDIEELFDIFPRLRERRTQLGGTLSGGEQQMLAICRALMVRPDLLLMDEPSMGLAPVVLEDIFRTIVTINRNLGTTIFLVEQNAALALAVSSYGYVLENGRISSKGSKAELIADDAIAKAYLGIKNGK